jgi:hypothetical protein
LRHWWQILALRVFKIFLSSLVLPLSEGQGEGVNEVEFPFVFNFERCFYHA